MDMRLLPLWVVLLPLWVVLLPLWVVLGVVDFVSTDLCLLLTVGCGRMLVPAVVV